MYSATEEPGLFLNRALAETGRAAPGGQSCLGEGLVVEFGVVWPPSKIVEYLAWRAAGRGGGGTRGDHLSHSYQWRRSGANIADGLGYHFYLRSSNLAIFSRFPIRATHDLFRPFNFGGVTHVSWSAAARFQYLVALPSRLWQQHERGRGSQRFSLAAEGGRDSCRRGGAIAGGAGPNSDRTAETPVIVAGDFNSPSHLDWRLDTATRHRGLVVDWPVSLFMQRAGFVDVHPPRWPSDHGAVSATLRLN